MSKFEFFVKRLNVPKLYKAGIAISLSLVLLATAYGLFNGSVLAYGVVYSFRALGIFLVFYCLKCYSEGGEHFVSSGWTEKEFTKENHPYQFAVLLYTLLFLSFGCTLSWFTIDI